MTKPAYGNGIMADFEIREACQGKQPMISPFQEKLVEKGKVSYGVDPFGYSVRLGYVFKVVSSVRGWVLDPKEAEKVNWTTLNLEPGETFDIFPGMLVLAETLEEFHMPSNVLGLVTNKSTYARFGLHHPSTTLEPGWKGRLTLELFNSNRHPLRIYPGEGIVQILFFAASHDAEVDYAKRDGKYQNQAGVTPGKIKG